MAIRSLNQYEPPVNTSPIASPTNRPVVPPMRPPIPMKSTPRAARTTAVFTVLRFIAEGYRRSGRPPPGPFGPFGPTGGGPRQS